MASTAGGSGANMGRATSKNVICSETEIEMHRIIYNWEISNFDRICTPESDEFEPISSNPFRAGQEINRDSEWDLILSAEGGYLQIWLYLKRIMNDLIKDISVNLTVLILKADGSTLLRRRCDKNQSFTAEDNGWGMGYIITIETLWDEKDVYLIDNKLRLQIQLDILGDLVSRVKTPSTVTMMAIAANAKKAAKCSTSSSGTKRKRSSDDSSSEKEEESSDIFEASGYTHLKRDMKKLFRSRHDTDFTIECGHKSFPVHKLILSARSKVFAAMFKHDTTENRSNIVKIEDIPPSTVERLIEYVYTGTVKLPSDLDDVMSLVQASDKYQLDELKNRCLRTLCIQISLDNVGKVAILAYLHNAELFIQEEIRQYCQSNWDALLKLKSFKECLISTPRAFFDDLKSLSDSD